MSAPEERKQPPPESFPLMPQQGPYPPGAPQAPAPGPYPPPATTNQPGPYPPPQGGHPPAQAQGAYPPPQSGYPPAQGGYPPAQPGYPPPQGGYPPAQPGHPPPQGVYYPPGSGFPQGFPVTNQPLGYGGAPVVPWMAAPQGVPNCPPGLEYLSALNQILVHQQVELLEIISSFETENRYAIKNSFGQMVYFAAEESDCCTRNCCGPRRSFDMKVSDNFGNEVIHFYRPLACQSCCFPCCLQSMEVSSPPGTIIGTVEQQWSLCLPKFAIKNAAGDVVLRVEGPFCTCSCGSDVEFKVYSPDGDAELGKIAKQWSGFEKEALTDADNFGITFPQDLDVKMKAVMLGACFLIDMMYYEHSQNQNR